MGTNHGPEAVRDPRKLAKAIRLRAEGKSAVDTAALVGVAARTIWRWEDRADVKRRIEEQAQQIVEMAPRAIDTYRQIFEAAAQAETVPHLVQYPVVDQDNNVIVNETTGLPQTFLAPADSKMVANNVKLLALAKDSARDILQTAGIMPYHSDSRVINNIFIMGDSAQVSPLVGKILGRIAGLEEPEPDVIDAEFDSVD